MSTAELAVMFEVYQANIRIARDDRPARAIRAPIHLVSASERPRANEQTPDRGWAKLTASYVNASESEGDHVSMMKREHAAHLARALNPLIEKVLSSRRGAP
ncbi:MAG TPA: hypothetical protein VKG79_07385 [Bryobacteraceae bacterium]|nr:hypothetical protein [Bryobacteraceae bacterium]